MKLSIPRKATFACCNEERRTRRCANVSTRYNVTVSDARIIEAEARGEEVDVKSVELSDERKTALSCVVIRTTRPFWGNCRAKVIEKVISSAADSDVIKRGFEDEDKPSWISTREGRKKEVGGVIRPFEVTSHPRRGVVVRHCGQCPSNL